MESVNQRFQFLVDKLFGGNATKFAVEFGLSQSTVKDILGTRKNSPSFQTIVKIISAKKYNISPDWLLLNIGDYKRSDTVLNDLLEKVEILKETIALQKTVLEMKNLELE